MSYLDLLPWSGTALAICAALWYRYRYGVLRDELAALAMERAQLEAEANHARKAEAALAADQAKESADDRTRIANLAPAGLAADLNQLHPGSAGGGPSTAVPPPDPKHISGFRRQL